MRMRSSLKRFLRDPSGMVATEYALILTLITIGVIGSTVSMGESVTQFFNNALAGFTR